MNTQTITERTAGGQTREPVAEVQGENTGAGFRTSVSP